MIQDYRVHSHFHSPPADLEGCFTTFYHMNLEVSHGRTVTDYLQPEWANIRFFDRATPSASIAATSASGARFSATGPSSRPTRFELGSTRMWGVGFLPLGWAHYFDVEASTLANCVSDGAGHPVFGRFAPLVDVLCDPVLDEQSQLDAIIDTMRTLARPSRDDDKIRRVHRALVDEGPSTVGDFAEQANMNIRTLERVCGRYFGFAPKLLMRRQRFMRTLSAFMLGESSTWSKVIDAHYHDQAQFTREFHEFMTMNPSEYAALDHPILTSFMAARARAWGSPAQTLDEPH